MTLIIYQYFSEDKYLRMHLKGRPVCLYAPSDVDEGYNVRSPQEPPDAQLKLEWVYPFMQIVHRGYSNFLLNMAFISSSEVENIYIS